MGARSVEPLCATSQSKPTLEEDNSGPPLLPSEKSNTIRSTLKPRSVASRYMNGISSTPVSSSSNSKRCSPPNFSHSHTSTVPGMSMPKRSQSAERRRPVKPSSRFSAPPSPSRPSTPSSRPATPVRDVAVTHNATRHLLSNKARDGLWPSMRSLSSSFQSESLVVQEKKREILMANSSSVKSIKSLADVVSERKRTPLRGRNTSDQSENSKPPGNSNAKILDQHRWPAMMGGKLPPSAMSRSLDISDKISKSTRTVASRGISPNRINLSTDSASRDSKFSLSNASGQSLNHGGRKVERDVKPVVSSSPQTTMRSLSAKRPSSNQSSSTPGLHPSSPRSRSSVIPCLHHPSSPSKVLSASPSTSKGMMSPLRTRPSSPISLSTNVTSRAGGTSSVLKWSGDVQRGKLTASEIEDAHQLKLLYNASMRWCFVNAQTNKTLSIQRMGTENLLQNGWNDMSMLRNSVTMKRIDVHQLQGDLRLGISLKEQEILESMGEFVDGLKFSGGSHSLMPNDFIKEITDLAHKHNMYVSTGDWAEHLLRKGSSSFKQYVEECKSLGFDTIELNAGSLKLPEDVLLRFIRLIKSSGLKAKPQFSINFEKSDIPVAGHRAFGAYISPVPESSELVEDVDLLIRRAERCLEAGADIIMIDADDVCKHAELLRSDIIAKIIGRLGLQKTMFEASNNKTSEWFVKRYGPRVNLFVDHSEVMNLECLRGRNLGRNHSSVLGPSFFLV